MLTIVRMTELARPFVGTSMEALTIRERDCLIYVAEGLSDREIGEKLGISHTTTHAHVENGKRKLGARTRAQAVARLFLLGLAWSPAPVRTLAVRDPAPERQQARGEARRGRRP